MNDYIAHENQTLFDVSSHVYGDFINAFKIAKLNDLSISETLVSGQIVKLIDVNVNSLVLKALEARSIIPATGIKKEEINQLPSGIGYMRIGVDFKVN